MKTKIKILVISLIAILMVVLGLLFAINYKKGSVKYFYQGGYVINNIYETDEISSVDKIYFDDAASYVEHSNNQVSFTNSNGDKTVISDENFIHYTDNSIMALKDGVAIDLDNIDSKLLGYYNVFSDSVLSKTSSGYEINNLNETIVFKKLMFKISNNKYLIGADDIVVAFSDEQTVNLKNYVEIEYTNENVIRIYNDEVNYQTIASNLYLIIDNVKIDLEYKTISKNNVKYLTMADMVINADDNIEVLKEEPSKDNNKDNQENSNDQNSNIGDTNTEDNNNIDSNIKDALDNIINNAGGSNEQIDDEPSYIQPKFTVETIEVSALGFENFQVSFSDESGILYGNRMVELVENSTGKVVQSFDEWIEGNTNYSINSYNSLKPNTEYTINITGKYKIDDVEYDRVFVSKIFRTLDIGLEITQDYVTDDSVSFAVYRKDSSNIEGFSYDILNSNDESLCTGDIIYDVESKLVTVSCDENIKPNSAYEFSITKIIYGNEIISVKDFPSLEVSYKLKSLKEKPNKNAELIYSVNSANNILTLGIKGINDPNEGIISYTYKVYDNVKTNDGSDLIYSSIKDRYSDLQLPIGNIQNENEQNTSFTLEIGKCYYAEVEVAFDDNEKTILYEIPLGGELSESESYGLICTGENSYPRVVGFTPSESMENGVQEKISGSITVDNSDSTYPAVNKYNIEIRENSGSVLDKNQLVSTTSIIAEESLISYLPVEVSGLKPNTEYTMSVYLVDGTNQVYIGKVSAKTNITEPIRLNLENLEDFKSSDYRDKIFAVNVSGDSGYFSIVDNIEFKLMGCINNNNCILLDYKRTIPKDQNSENNVINSFSEKETIIIDSSEFGFYQKDYNAAYQTYKLVAKATAKQNYEIPVIINASNYEEEYILEQLKEEVNSREINKYELKINEMDPMLDLKVVDIPNMGKYEELDTDTIIGYTLDFNIISGIGSTKEIDAIYYRIIDGACIQTSIPIDSDGWNELTVSSNTINLQINENIGSSNKIEQRGKKYCIQYYGKNNDSIFTSTEGYVDYVEINPLKQSAKVKGYLSGYDGKNATFKLEISDPDAAISSDGIYLKVRDDATKFIPTVSDNLYTFAVSPDKSFYQLIMEQNLGNGITEQTLYLTEELGPTILNPEFNLVINTSQPGKIVFRVYYKNNEIGTIPINENTNRISKIKLGSRYLDLQNSLDGYLYSEVSLSELETYGIEISNDSTINLEDKVEIVYENGGIVDYSEESSYFLKRIFSEDGINYNYFNITDDDIKQVDTILNANIYNSNNTIRNLLSVKEDVVGLWLDEYYSISSREASFIKPKLYNKDYVEITNSIFEVTEVLTTSDITYVYNSTGANIYFDIVSGLKNTTALGVELIAKDSSGESKCEYYYIKNDNGGYYTESSSESCNQVVIGITDSKVNVIFENLNRDSSYTYSIIFKEENNVSYTYNKDTSYYNDGLQISALKSLTYDSSSVQYSSGNHWYYEVNDILHQKQLQINFVVDNSKYLLSEGESINYDIVAVRGDEKFILYNNEPLTLNNLNYDYRTLRENLFGEYVIVINPYIIKGDKYIPLDQEELGTITVTSDSPTIFVENTTTASIPFVIEDKDGMLSDCDGAIDNEGNNISEDNFDYNVNTSDFNKNYYSYFISTDNAKKYLNSENLGSMVNFQNKKVVHFELYDSTGQTLVAYSPIPFPEYNLTINLEEYFINNSNLDGGVYYPVVKYCTLESGQKKYNVKSLGEIEINKNAYFLNMDGIYIGSSFGSAFVITFNNPDSEIFGRISKVEYQYTTIGSGGRIHTDSNFNLQYTINSQPNGSKLYALTLLLSEASMTTKIQNLTAKFFDINGNEIATYSYVSNISE